MFRKLLTLSFLLAGSLASSASAQCFGPDGLEGPCWVPTAANLPALPQVSMTGLNLCWTNCDPQQRDNILNLDAPQQQKCGQYGARLDVLDASGAALLSGVVTLDYTRTWGETTPGPIGRRLQVYRFLAKVDLRQASANVDPCQVPSCIAAWQSAFYYGYVDYAFDCLSGDVESVITLFHNCDAFIHKQGVSSKPGTFHPETSFGIVGPHTAANPFVPAFNPAAGGPIQAEAMRLVPAAAGAACITEDPIKQGAIRVLGAGCGCTFNPNPQQLYARHMNGRASCVNALGQQSWFRSLKVYPSLPWYEVMTTSLGNWTTDASYPGREQVWVDEGAFLVKDACSASQGGASGFGEIYYGASTSEGWFVQQSPTVALTQNFTDLAANHSFPLPGPATFPMVGDVRRTRNLIYVNVP